MEGTRDTPTTRTPAPHTRESLLAALAEAVHDHDERTLRRLLARLAEQVTIADLPALRNALDTARRHPRRPDRHHRRPDGTGIENVQQALGRTNAAALLEGPH